MSWDRLCACALKARAGYKKTPLGRLSCEAKTSRGPLCPGRIGWGCLWVGRVATRGNVLSVFLGAGRGSRSCECRQAEFLLLSAFRLFFGYFLSSVFTSGALDFPGNGNFSLFGMGYSNKYLGFPLKNVENKLGLPLKLRVYSTLWFFPWQALKTMCQTINSGL